MKGEEGKITESMLADIFRTYSMDCHLDGVRRKAGKAFLGRHHYLITYVVVLGGGLHA